MRLCIGWTVFLRVTTGAKCEKAIEKIRHALGLPLEIGLMEPYWKDKQNLYKVLATTCVDAASTTDAFYRIMKAANGVARFWTVNGPSESGAWEFAGTASPGSAKIQEIDSVSFSTTENQSQANDAIAARA